uniref:Protein Wnt n=1 Tax=Parascaris equorum TaxID=6256 RepID=A0A914RMQ1_PAREQ
MKQKIKLNKISKNPILTMNKIRLQLEFSREVGTIIKDKFDGATEVAIIEEDNKPTIVRKNVQFKRHTKADLVYLDSSPDYCEPDPARGVLGTHGRLCNVSSHGIDGCELLCCYRGFETRVRRVMDRCNCKFHYCCRVDCELCEKVIEDHLCK